MGAWELPSDFNKLFWLVFWIEINNIYIKYYFLVCPTLQCAFSSFLKMHNYSISHTHPCPFTHTIQCVNTHAYFLPDLHSFLTHHTFDIFVAYYIRLWRISECSMCLSHPPAFQKVSCLTLLCISVWINYSVFHILCAQCMLVDWLIQNISKCAIVLWASVCWWPPYA